MNGGVSEAASSPDGHEVLHPFWVFWACLVNVKRPRATPSSHWLDPGPEPRGVTPLLRHDVDVKHDVAFSYRLPANTFQPVVPFSWMNDLMPTVSVKRRLVTTATARWTEPLAADEVAQRENNYTNKTLWLLSLHLWATTFHCEEEETNKSSHTVHRQQLSLWTPRI